MSPPKTATVSTRAPPASRKFKVCGPVEMQGFPVPKEIIERAVKYIERCTTPEGGVQYSIRGGGARPAITAAAVACLFNSGQYDNEYVRKLLKYCKKNVWPGKSGHSYFGHWHYTHYYYAQVMYRLGDKSWERLFRCH